MGAKYANKLMDKGYIMIDNEGKIRNELKLTESGLNIKQDIYLAFRQVYGEMTDGIPKEELNKLQSILGKMKENVG